LLTGVNLNTTALLSNIHYQPFGGASDWTYGNGVKNTRYYDLDGRIDSLWLGNATRDITYDAASNIANFKNSDTPVYQEFTYDVVDRLVGHTDYAGTAFTLNYDANGNRTQFKNGRAVGTISFSVIVRMWRPNIPPITLKLIGATNYQPFGGASDWTYGNGVKNTRYYDPEGRINSLWLGNATRDITYDAASNIANFKNSDTPVYQEFTYDVVDRLVGHTDYAGTAFTLNYDANGNRTQFKNGSANAVNYSVAATSNRLLNTSQTGGTTKTYTIDATGNTTSDGKNTYTYDGRSRLVQAAGPGFTTEYYRINGLGQRTAKVTGTAPDLNGDVNQDGLITSSDATQLSQLITAGTATVNVYNDCNKDGSVNASDVTCINTKIADIAANPSKYIQTGTYFAYDEAGHLLGEYTQAGTAIQETVWLGDIPVAVLNSTGNYYIYPDHLNTPRAIADSTNKTVWRWKDPAFGTSQPDQDPDKDGKAFVYNLRFPGQYYDQSTGLHYNWFRDYDPFTGRYVESDPIGLAGGLNTYGYVNGNSINLVDPRGESIVAAGRGLLFGLGMLATSAADNSFKGRLDSFINACKYDDDNDCDKEWEDAYARCEQLISDPIHKNNWNLVGKRPPTLNSCAKGYVSQRCGGSKI
jgi:RHS repeat-associated protein